MENLFVETSDPARIVAALANYNPTAEPAPGWGSVPPYPSTVRVSPLRTDIAESEDFPRLWPSVYAKGGKTLNWRWIQLVRHDDRVDLAMARWLSQQLETLVVAAFAYDGSDTYGSRYYRDGELTYDEHHEMEERAEYRIGQELEGLRIPHTLRRSADCHGPGWQVVEIP